MGMTNELSTERAIEALYTVRAYYASLTAGYPKGKDCRGIGDVMCSEIANSCLMAIKALEQARPNGKWKRISPAGIYECTNCNQMIMTSDIDCYKYCHGCGAKMEVSE